MTIHDFTNAYPDDHFRIIRYIPAPDIMNEYGELVCGGEGESSVVFDSTTGDGDMPFDIMLQEITTFSDDTFEGHPVHELEYIPDEYWA